MPEPEPALSDPTERCFIISPISDEKTNARRLEKQKADFFLTTIFEPVCDDIGYPARRMDRNPESNLISDSMIEALATDPIAIALLDKQILEEGDCLSFNPNVVYEIGLRHAWCLPVVIVTSLSGSQLPFDLRDCPVVKFPPVQDDADWSTPADLWESEEEIQKLKTDLTARLEAALNQKNQSFVNRYQNGLAVRSKTSQLVLILNTKVRSLRALKRSIDRFPKKMAADTELKNGKWEGFIPLAKIWSSYLKDFESETMTCKWIGEDQLDGIAGSPQMMEICEEMIALEKELANIEGQLMAKPAPQEDLNQRQKCILDHIEESKKLTTQCIANAIDLLQKLQ